MIIIQEHWQFGVPSSGEYIKMVWASWKMKDWLLQDKSIRVANLKGKRNLSKLNITQLKLI